MKYNLFFLLPFVIASCTLSKRAIILRDLETAEARFQDHKGFALYDPLKNKFLVEHQSNRYFIPASNTKILTLFASLQILGDSIPGIYYTIQGDSMIIQGSGDPSFLYKHVYQNNSVFDFLKGARQEIYFTDANFKAAHLGPGWAWSDYNYAYSPERSAFPVYGNIFKVIKPMYQSSLQIEQTYFKKFFWLGDSLTRTPYVLREQGSNRIDYFPGIQMRDMSWEVPFRTSPELITELLADTLKRPVSYLRKSNRLRDKKVLYSIPADSLYKVMMEESDNFIAEQLLLLCAGVLRDTLDPEITIRYMQENYFKALPDKPVWVDGSGLSRYNLVTPQSVIDLWKKLYENVPQERLFALLATGGVSGTLKNAYKAEIPYVFGKTGTLRNNHNLSGFVRTKSGKILIFSFMNNAFTQPTAEIRAEMERILRYIYEKY